MDVGVFLSCFFAVIVGLAFFISGISRVNSLMLFMGIVLIVAGLFVTLQADVADASHAQAEEIPTPTIGPGYGWSCLPVNNSTVPGEIVCRPVTLEAGS